jgi:serine/threonine-protein kinase
MPELTAEQIAQRCFDLGLLDQRQLEAVWGEVGTRDASPEAVKSLLLRREYVTNFQLERLLRGERGGYFYGNYKVLYLVGSGTFARAYRAVENKTGKVVAIKALRRRFADDPTTTEQFMREGEMGKTLRHPNIVPIYEVHTQGKQPFLVMDFVEGRSLREFVKIRGKLDPAEATKLAIDIAAGLSYAFEKGITHRDLRMSNVLVTALGKARLVDFGLAAMNVNLNSDEAIDNCPNPRTIDYAALERVTGVRKDDPRSDIYFAGCLYYHMLSGEPPLYETRDRVARMSINRFQDIQPISDVVPNLPAAVVKIVNKSMELNPKKRYQSPAELLADLKLLERRFGQAGGDGEIELSAPGEGSAVGAIDSVPQEGVGKTLMLVESNTTMQDALRERLKKHGYRVLVISDPVRAYQRFETAQPHEKVADALILFTHELGEKGIEWFNRFATLDATRNLPAILLLGEKQAALQSSAKLSGHRVSMMMPLKLKELRQTLAKLLGLTMA